MNLVSIYCSGESLEKAVVLFTNAYKDNKTFYDGFDKIYVFYGNDLKKGKKDTRIIPGSFDFYKLVFDKEVDISINEVLKLLYVEKVINEKTYYKYLEDILNDKSTIGSQIKCLFPLTHIDRTLKTDLLNSASSICSKVKFVYIDAKEMLIEYILNNEFDFYSRIYALNSELNVSSFDLSNMNYGKRINMVERISRNILLSSNVYMFIGLIKQYCERNLDELYVYGIRKMDRFPRISYNAAIALFDSNELLIEPKIKRMEAYFTKYRLMGIREENIMTSIIREEIQKILING